MSARLRWTSENRGSSVCMPASATKNALRVRTVGTVSNHDGIGARVEIALAGGQRQWQLVKTGSSYCSQSELPVTFGLGEAARVAEVRVKWPSGRVDTIANVAANQLITVQEGKGLVAQGPPASAGVALLPSLRRRGVAKP